MNGPNELYKTYGQLTQTHCYECGKVGELQACSRCRVRLPAHSHALNRQRASFCSRACAAKAWSSSKPHKGFCKAWADMVAAGDGYAASDRAEAMDQCLSDLGLLMPALTGVYAHPALAKDLIYSEARCSSCCCTARGRASEGSRTSLQALRTCGDCGVARWCEACEGDGLRAHAADRDEDGRSQCEVLAEAAADQTISMIYHRDPHRPGPLLITQPEQCLSKPEPLPDNWTDYLSSWDCDAPPPFERTMTTLSLSFPLTVIAAIERFGLLERFDPPTSTPVRELEIHLIGAEVEVELVISGPTWEQLLHRLPTVKRLRLVLVGPSIKAGEQGTIHHDCCPTCTRAGRTRTVVLHQVRTLLLRSG